MGGMEQDHLQHAGSAEIPKRSEVHASELIVRPIEMPAPYDHRLPVVRETIFAQLLSMKPGECLEMNRSIGMTKHYSYRFRVETGRREWRFRIRRIPGLPGWSRVWRIADVHLANLVIEIEELAEVS